MLIIVSPYIDEAALRYLKSKIYKNSGSTHRFKLPLHLALTISPIVLLIPAQLFLADWDRQAVLLVSKVFSCTSLSSIFVTDFIDVKGPR